MDHLEVFLDLTITWKPPKWYVELMEKINNGGYNEGITDRKGGANHNITVIQWDIHSFFTLYDLGLSENRYRYTPMYCNSKGNIMVNQQIRGFPIF